MKKNLEFLRQNLIAHRGMHNIKEGIPENSLKAFEKAIELGVPRPELQDKLKASK